MIKKWKRLVTSVVAFTLVTCMMFPLVGLSATTEASVRGFSAENTTVNAGQSTIISVTTNDITSHVFATVDGANVAGSFRSEGGHKIWTITFTPRATQLIPVYINTANSTSGAIVMFVQVTVAGGTANVGTGTTTGTGGVAINDIWEARGTSAGQAVLTVETSARANDVWVQFDGDKYAKGRLDSETANTRTWTITFRPSGAQLLTVSANTGYFTRGAANQQFQLTMGATTAPPTTSVPTGDATITGVRSSRSNVIIGESITLTITTNAHATDVWVLVDGHDMDARMTRQTRTAKTWTVTFTPDRSQTLTVYANSGSHDLAGSVNRTHRITVNDRRFENARIHTAHVENNFQNASYARIIVETNSATNFVWVNVGGNRLAGMSSRSVLSNGNIRWSYDLYWADWNWNWFGNNWNQTVTVHAGESNGVSNDSRTLNVNWWGGFNPPVNNATIHLSNALNSNLLTVSTGWNFPFGTHGYIVRMVNQTVPSKTHDIPHVVGGVFNWTVTEPAVTGVLGQEVWRAELRTVSGQLIATSGTVTVIKPEPI
jgi:hypothetical protein